MRRVSQKGQRLTESGIENLEIWNLDLGDN
jgi:hypothetical protein